MIVLLSPAKKLDFDSPCSWTATNEPIFQNQASNLIKNLKKLKPADISKLMKLSQPLSELNYKRYQSFKNTYNTDLSKQAAFAFNGDTYTGLQVNSLDTQSLKRSRDQLRILSGLYGVLKPHDLIQPYRLEMGTKFKFDKYKDLYDYWGDQVTNVINEELTSHKFLVNCASQEYFKVVNANQIVKPIINPVFMDFKNGDYKIISFFAKKARGMMARYILTENCKSLADIQAFNLDNYKFNKKLTQDDHQPVFTRKQ